MQRWIGLTLALATVSGFAAEIACDLEGMRIGEKKIGFGERVEMTGRNPGPVSFWELTPIHGGMNFEIERIGGEPVGTPLRVLAFGAVPEELPADHLFRLRGHFGDAFAEGGRIRASFKVEEIKDLGESAAGDATDPPIDWESFEGKEVSLRGKLWSMNGAWWFRSQDRALHLGTSTGRCRTFPTHWHGVEVEVRGTLRHQLRFPPGFRNDDKGLKRCPVIFDASVKPTDRRTDSDEKNRFRQLFATSPKRKDGVFDLLPEEPVYRNIMGHETRALSYSTRNRPWLMDIVRTADSAALDVIAGRMLDEARNKTLRVIDAGILAARDDPRGRRFLSERLAALSDPDTEIADALFVLGAFAGWNEEQPPDLDWAEDLAVRSFREAPVFTVAFSNVPELLVQIESRPGIDLICERIRDKSWNVSKGDLFNWPDADRELVQALIRSKPGVIPDKLLVSLLPALAGDDWAERDIGRELLDRDVVEALDPLLAKITEDWWDIDFRDHAGPRILAEIRKRAPSLEGETAKAVDMVLVHHSGDAVRILITRLEDPETPIEKFNRIRWQLHNVEDGAKAAVPLARFIRQRILPSGKEPEFGGNLVLEAMRLIGESDDRAAVSEMIELLACDFAILGSEHFPEPLFRNTVADQLAQMTGVSFGTDAAKWRAWFEAGAQ